MVFDSHFKDIDYSKAIQEMMHPSIMFYKRLNLIKFLEKKYVVE